MAIPGEKKKKKKTNIQLQVSRENVFATKTHHESELLKRFQQNYLIMVLASPKRRKQLKTW